MNDQSKHPRRVTEQSSALDPAIANPTQRTTVKDFSNSEFAEKKTDSADQRRVHQRTVSIEETGDSTDQSATVLNASAPSKPGIWRSAFWLTIAMIATWALSSTTLTLIELWQQNKALAIPLAIFGILLLILLSHALKEEVTALRCIDQLEKTQADILHARDVADLQKLKSSLKPTLDTLEQRHPELMLTFKEASSTRTDCHDYLDTLNNLVLLRLDDAVNSTIKRSSLMIGTAVAISPHPALDAIIVLWRAQALVRDIGEIYGLRLTGLSSWRLMKYLFNSALLAAAMDAAGSLIIEEAGRGAIESAGKKTAEGLVIGSRIYRLGVIAQKTCRPIPF